MKRTLPIIGGTIVFASSAMLLLSFACTWAIAHGASIRWRAAFLLFCHGIPSRCLTIWNVPMPICARCTAIYAGMLISVLVFAVMPRLPEIVARVMLIASTAAIALDGVTQAFHLRESTNELRLITGFAFGIAFCVWVLASVRDNMRRIAAERGISS
jgi:uncharacterized membrane protein